MAKRQGSRRQHRLARRAEREREETARSRADAQRRTWLVGIALGTLGGALALYFANAPKSLLGLLLLLGSGGFLVVALGGLAGGVKPRDRSKSGNIDYGN